MNLNPATVFHEVDEPTLLIHRFGALHITASMVINPNQDQAEILSGIYHDGYNWEDTGLQEVHVLQALLQQPYAREDDPVLRWRRIMGHHWVDMMEQHGRHCQSDQIYRRRLLNIYETTRSQLDANQSFSENLVARQLSALKQAITFCYSNLWFYPVPVVIEIVRDGLAHDRQQRVSRGN